MQHRNNFYKKLNKIETAYKSRVARARSIYHEKLVKFYKNQLIKKKTVVVPPQVRTVLMEDHDLKIETIASYKITRVCDDFTFDQLSGESSILDIENIPYIHDKEGYYVPDGYMSSIKKGELVPQQTLMLVKIRLV